MTSCGAAGVTFASFATPPRRPLDELAILSLRAIILRAIILRAIIQGRLI